jgi:enolase
VGDEGGFAPRLESNEQALELLVSAIEKAGYELGDEISLALDVAATEFYADGSYNWEGKKISAQAMTDIYASWCKKYPIISVEDGLAEDDWDGWKHMTQKLGGHVQLVGDDIFVTNIDRIKRGVKEKCANALLVKVNQIGTLTETIQAVQFAQSSGYNTVMSHRSGETEDVTIADLAVALNCRQIKTGSLCRSERVAKYNQLLRIEEQLVKSATFAQL